MSSPRFEPWLMPETIRSAVKPSIRPSAAKRTQSTGVPSVAKPTVPSPNGTSSTHSGRRVVIERAVAERLESGAMTASSTSVDLARSARRSACSPSASIPSSLVRRTRSTAERIECASPTLPVRPGRGVLARLAARRMGTIAVPAHAPRLRRLHRRGGGRASTPARPSSTAATSPTARSATLAQDEVDDEIAARFTTGVIERSPGLVTLRPALEAAAADVVASPGFAAEFGAGMRELHRGIFTGATPRPTLRVPGMTAQVRAADRPAHARARPAAAARAPTRR